MNDSKEAMSYTRQKPAVMHEAKPEAGQDEYPSMTSTFKPSGIEITFNSLGYKISAGMQRDADRMQVRALKALHAKFLQKHREQLMKEGK